MSSRVLRALALALVAVAACGGGGTGGTADATIDSGLVPPVDAPSGSGGAIDAAVDAPDSADAAVDAPPSPGNPQLAVVDDVGHAIAALDFGVQYPGDEFHQTLHVINAGGGTTGPISAAIIGDAAFTLDPASACAGVALAAGSACDLVVAYVVSDNASATLSIGGAPGGSYSVPLHGTAEAISLTIVGPSFGTVAVGESLDQTYTYANQHNVPVTVDDFILSSTQLGSGTGAPNPFSLVSTDCTVVPASGVCHLVVRFAPTAITPYALSILLQGSKAEPVSTFTATGGAA